MSLRRSRPISPPALPPPQVVQTPTCEATSKFASFFEILIQIDRGLSKRDRKARKFDDIETALACCGCSQCCCCCCHCNCCRWYFCICNYIAICY